MLEKNFLVHLEKKNHYVVNRNTKTPINFHVYNTCNFGTLTELITEYMSSNLVSTKGTERIVQGNLAFKKSRGKKRKGKLITLIAVIRTFSLIAVGLPTFSLECIEGTSGHTLLWKPYTVAETCSQHAVTMLG